MGIDKKRVKPVTVYVPREIYEALKRFHATEGRPYMSDTAMIVNLLQRWYNERTAMQPPIRERIGEGLVRRGKITQEQAEKVLELQQDKYHFSKRFGEIALELMYINR
jgi:hypothetical protein